MKITTETPFNIYCLEASHTSNVLLINIYMNNELNTSLHLNINNRLKLEKMYHNIEDFCWVNFQSKSSDTEYRNELQKLTELLYRSKFTTIETDEGAAPII